MLHRQAKVTMTGVLWVGIGDNPGPLLPRRTGWPARGLMPSLWATCTRSPWSFGRPATAPRSTFSSMQPDAFRRAKYRGLASVGGSVALPVVLIYTGAVFGIFRDNVAKSVSGYGAEASALVSPRQLGRITSGRQE